MHLQGDHKSSDAKNVQPSSAVSMPHASNNLPNTTSRIFDAVFKLDTPDLHNWVNQFIDPGWDSILICVYGQNTMTDTGAKTQLNLEIAMNHKVIYTEHS